MLILGVEISKKYPPAAFLNVFECYILTGKENQLIHENDLAESAGKVLL
jgi:hypothetical protein